MTAYQRNMSEATASQYSFIRRLAADERRIVLYHQTQYIDGCKYVSLKNLIDMNPGLTHLIIAAVHINDDPNRITLNDNTFDWDAYLPLWEECRQLQLRGVRIMAMLGGAAKGSFLRLSGNDEQFDRYYTPLRDLIEEYRFDGIDLDVEEPMPLEAIIRLIDRLKADFGQRFVITLAPVATALIPGCRHLSGFSYVDLEVLRGDSIAWYNTQFYNGWGYLSDDRVWNAIMQVGWPAKKVVMGVLTNTANGSGFVGMGVLAAVVAKILDNYPDMGGIMGWEYFNALPGGTERPWEWVNCISWIFITEYTYRRAAQLAINDVRRSLLRP